ncbi:MAG TPA: MGMT family protein [Gaiellaceae bacterium]|nr:MGMT family protein [Gaiellaceae bacterium]
MRATLTRYSVPGWGDGELWMRGRVVLAHDFSYLDSGRRDRGDRCGPRPPEGAASPPTGTLIAKSSRRGHGSAPTSHRENGPDQGDVAEDLVGRLADYLAGIDVRLGDVELDFSWATPFQHAVADALRRIPRGEVVTYGELAALAGHPGAARAVGSFCAHNRFALLVPCHRVVGSVGLGGYGATGLAVKRRLLALEGVVP